jgi:hypothetical protein
MDAPLRPIHARLTILRAPCEHIPALLHATAHPSQTWKLW